MARKVEFTYRARLVHLEDDGEFVADDSGEPMVEEVDVRLSFPYRKTERGMSAAHLRAAANMAIRKANTEALYERRFLVDGVDCVAKRVFPAR